MPVTQVLIENIIPGTQDVDVQWQSDQVAMDAMVYIAASQADLDDPTKWVAKAVLPSPVLDTVFRVTLPNIAAGEAPLQAGASYFCRCECDGIDSVSEPFTTVAPNVVYLRRPDADPRRIKKNGRVSELSIYVRKDQAGVPNVPVTFTVPSGCDGQLGPSGGAASGASFTATSDANGRAETDFTSGSATGKFKVKVETPGATDRRVRVVVRN